MEETLNKFSMHMDSEQQPEGSTRQNQMNRGVEDVMDYLRQINTENLLKLSEEELTKLEVKLEGILALVKNRKDSHTNNAVRCQSSELSHIPHEGSDAMSGISTRGLYFNYQQLQNGGHSEVTTYPERWTPPPTGVYKVNFAGVTISDMNVSGVGVGIVVRNWRGEFMAAQAKFWPELMDGSTTCLFAAKCALEFAVCYSFVHILVEGDDPSTIYTLQNMLQDHSVESNNIIQEARGCMRQLSSCVFSHLQTSGNTAAHMVALYAKNVADEDVWLMEEPDFLVDILLTDSSVEPMIR